MTPSIVIVRAIKRNSCPALPFFTMQNMQN